MQLGNTLSMSKYKASFSIRRLEFFLCPSRFSYLPAALTESDCCLPHYTWPLLSLQQGHRKVRKSEGGALSFHLIEIRLTIVCWNVGGLPPGSYGSDYISTWEPINSLVSQEIRQPKKCSAINCGETKSFVSLLTHCITTPQSAAKWEFFLSVFLITRKYGRLWHTIY